MKYLIFGNGYIGNKFKDALGGEAVISGVDIADYQAVKQELAQQKPDAVINCAGKTGKPNVDWCEDHKLETISSNVAGPLTLLRACGEEGIYWAHVGSGCVYTGDNGGKGYSEDDAPNFFGSFYSRTKAWSETMLKEFPVLQLRLRMPVDDTPGSRNLITKITTYKKVISTPNSVSVLEDFLRASLVLIGKRSTGIYNMTNPGGITHAEILDMYREIVDPFFAYEIFSLEELGAVTKAGRSNCVLSSDKRESAGAHMRPVREALRATLQTYKANLHRV
ncbi:sugar nucleotide-binding protein [Candidatus Uhrbacteria bacterium]|nr:sugar nucleotide-binding protein [Candidatus Uhrbacteria bacterium]